jgi:hypothetical protein
MAVASWRGGVIRPLFAAVAKAVKRTSAGEAGRERFAGLDRLPGALWWIAS